MAASNLVDGVSREVRRAYFSEAVRMASGMASPEYDEFMERLTHPLGSFRITPAANNTQQAKALYLAACLADDETQRSTIKQHVYVLLGFGDPSDYWPTRVLKRLGSSLTDDLGFLAGQGWALRSLAANLWAEHPVPEHLGRRLATDEDSRVRRALAKALAETGPTPAQAEARDLLIEDPAHSVRSLLPSAK